MLALGWLSVEDARSAEHHPFRIKEATVGEPLSEEKARILLSDALKAKGISDQKVIEDWRLDCNDALMAKIRDDAVWVNRARAFKDELDACDPDDARKILWRIFGSKFIELNLLEQEGLTDSKDDGSDNVESNMGHVAKAEPGEASRKVYGELWGGDPKEKQDLASKKKGFAKDLFAVLGAWDGSLNLSEYLSQWRKEQNFDQHLKKGSAFPPETKSGGKPTAVALRWRKMLVASELWPASKDEDGLIKGSHKDEARKFLVKVQKLKDEPKPKIGFLNGGNPDNDSQYLALYLMKACFDALSDEDDSFKVYTPSWAGNIQRKLCSATGISATEKSANEFCRLMFALAARRVSQTHSWIKLNELERHKAFEVQKSAKEMLEKLDPGGKAQKWLGDYEKERQRESGAGGDYAITAAAISAVDDVLAAWEPAKSKDERLEALPGIQHDAEKYGDHDLFESLADDLATCVWLSDAKTADSTILKNWVKYRKAQIDERRFKVPVYCHPDPFFHPAYCEFGASSKPGVYYQWRDGAQRNAEPGGAEDDKHCLWMQLPGQGGKTTLVPLRWRSKRLSKEFVIMDAVGDKEELPRAHRLGQAALGTSSEKFRPAYPFSENSKGWNARLEAKRIDLEVLSKYWNPENKTWKDGGTALRRLKWFATFSPDLEQRGPWFDYCAKANDTDLARPFVSSKGEYAVKHKNNDKRKQKIMLSRLPKLRILSVDLGLRHAAACAVWEAISAEEFAKEASAGTIVLGSKDDAALYAHVEVKDETGKSRKVIYRRIGPDTLPDSKAHPAPWARLDRQFLIKLQGEGGQTRKASAAEIDLVTQLEKDLGKQRPEDKPLPKRIDELMFEAVRTAKEALRRHGLRARIAFYLKDTDQKHLPGARTEPFTPESRLTSLVDDVLMNWVDLACNGNWEDKWAEKLWRDKIISKLGGPMLPLRKPDEGGRAFARTKKDFRPALEKVVQDLLTDKGLMEELQFEWDKRWHDDDGNHAKIHQPSGKKESDGTGWHARIRLLQNWIMPSKKNLTHKLGGLSPSRLAIMEDFRKKIQVAFFTRMTPKKAKHKDLPPNYGQSAMDALEHLRDNRVKQLASRIVEAALGVGSEDNEKHWSGENKTKRPRQRINDPRFAPCHAVVIENLSGYGTKEIRSRRENRQLMNWAKSKIKKFLAESCQLHGLHLREVMPNYTSQQDSRTGAPGMRCQDVPREKLEKEYWQKKIKDAQERIARAKGSNTDGFVAKIPKVLTDHPDLKLVRVPVKGGDIFVSADPNSPAARGIHADLNAAANIGLRALLDPDWAGTWCYVPCDVNGYPVKDKVAGCQVLEISKILGNPMQSAKKEVVNWWRDPSVSGLHLGEWKRHKEYFAEVEKKVIKILENPLPKGSVRPNVFMFDRQ